LLTFGFFDSQVTLSPSLGFWRAVIRRYTRPVIQTPDLEQLRHHVRIQPDELNPEELMEKVSLSVGAEYLSESLITSIWNQVEKSFNKAIKKYQGTVAAFIHEFNSATHLIGRDLVEKKKR
jgi:hypothetical protein